MNAIVTEKLTKRYKDVTAVYGLSLSVKKGELFALLGVNGAGKTTAVKMLCGITEPTGGNAWLSGKSIVTELRAVKGIIGVSPQETAVAPNLTVKENLELMCGVHGFSGNVKKQKVRELLKSFGLSDTAGKMASKLSGGWQRRLSIAMALISEPEILFLDEPTLGLDVIVRSELWELVRSFKGEKTVILTTHYLEEAEALSDRIGIMKGGRLLRVGTAAEIKAAAGAETLEEAFIKTVKEL